MKEILVRTYYRVFKKKKCFRLYTDEVYLKFGDIAIFPNETKAKCLGKNYFVIFTAQQNYRFQLKFVLVQKSSCRTFLVPGAGFEPT